MSEPNEREKKQYLTDAQQRDFDRMIAPLATPAGAYTKQPVIGLRPETEDERDERLIEKRAMGAGCHDECGPLLVDDDTPAPPAMLEDEALTDANKVVNIAPPAPEAPKSCETCKNFHNPFCLLQKGSNCYDAGYPSWEAGEFSIYKKS